MGIQDVIDGRKQGLSIILGRSGQIKAETLG